MPVTSQLIGTASSLDASDVIGQKPRGVLKRRPASCVFVEVVQKC
jgi:hypothetical protein